MEMVPGDFGVLGIKNTNILGNFTSYLSKAGGNSTFGTYSAPFSSKGFKTFIVARIVAIAIHTLLSAR
jgi:hypothetical protein